MTWTSPPTVVTGQLYTAAMFNTYTRDNPNHLKALLPDASGANLGLVSSSTTSAAFGLIPDAAMANQKINKSNGSAATFGAAIGLTQFYTIAGPADAPDSIPGENWYCMTVSDSNSPSTYFAQIAWSAGDVNHTFFRLVIGGVPSAWMKTWHRGNDGAGSGLDADTVDALNPGNGASNIAINNGVLNTTLNADQVDSHHAADITPNNARVWFDSVAEVTAAGAHWARDVALNGRLLLSADETGGNPSGVVFNPATNYGSHWVPMTGLSVGIGTLAGTVGSLDVGGSLSTEPNSVFVAGGGGGATTAHTHSITGLTVTGAPGISGAPALSGVGTQWLPMMRAGIWAKKS